MHVLHEAPLAPADSSHVTPLALHTDWVTAPAALVPRVVEALGGSSGDDVLALLADHADEVVLRGESTWLRSLGIDPDLHVETSG